MYYSGDYSFELKDAPMGYGRAQVTVIAYLDGHEAFRSTIGLPPARSSTDEGIIQSAISFAEAGCTDATDEETEPYSQPSAINENRLCFAGEGSPEIWYVTDNEANRWGPSA